MWIAIHYEKKPINKTVVAISEIGYKCREAICQERADSICLVSYSSNPADAMTKLKPNKASSMSLPINVRHTSPKHAFMPQKSRFCYCTFINISAVLMSGYDNESS